MIEGSLCVVAIVGPLLVISARLYLKKRITKPDGTVEERAWGIGVRMIQLIAILLLIPVIVILGLEEVLSKEGIGTLLGTIVGYALGGIVNPVPKENG